MNVQLHSSFRATNVVEATKQVADAADAAATITIVRVLCSVATIATVSVLCGVAK